MTLSLGALGVNAARLCQVAPGPLTPPQVVSAVQASSAGGTLGSQTTYWVQATANNAAGESLPSPEFSYFLGTTGTNTNQVTYNIVVYPGTTSVKFYRATAQGGEALVGSVTGITWSTAELVAGLKTITYTDTGTVGGATPPTADTSGTAAEAGVYTVPTGKVATIAQVAISNRGSAAATCGLSLIPNGGSADGTHWVIPPNFTIQPGDTRTVALGHALEAGGQVGVAASSALVTVTVSGSTIGA